MMTQALYPGMMPYAGMMPPQPYPGKCTYALKVECISRQCGIAVQCLTRASLLSCTNTGMMMQYPGMMGGMPQDMSGSMMGGMPDMSGLPSPNNGMGPSMFGSDQQSPSYDGTPAHNESPSAAAKGTIPEEAKKPATMTKEEEDGSGNDQTSQKNNSESEAKSEEV